jgi:hypothetical protein
MNDQNNGVAPAPLQVAEAVAQYAPAAAQPAAAVPFKYGAQIRTIAKCPVHPHFTDLGMGYRFAKADIDHADNYLPIAKIDPDRTLHGQKPVTECCTGWALSMYTTVDALVARVHKAGVYAPKLLKRVGDHFIQVKLTPACGVHTGINDEGHFDFFERETFNGKNAVVAHGKMKL